MAEIRQLTEDQAREISDRDTAKILGKTYYDKNDGLCYEVDGKFYEIWITNDSSC